MSLFAAIGAAARTVAAGAGRFLQEYAHNIPAVPGTGTPGMGSYQLPRDWRQQRIINSREALGGRTTYTAGSVPPWISTYAGDLTARRIRAIHNEVMVAGYMVNKASLDEHIVLNDSHLKSVDGSFRDSISGRPFDFLPADESPLALHIADYQACVAKRAIAGYQESCRRQLFGNAAGYAVEEAIFDTEPRPFSCTLGGERVEVWGYHPRERQWVSNKATRWQVDQDRLEIDFGGRMVLPPARKFAVFEASDDFQVRRRGYMYPGVWLHLIKSNAIARWAVVLEVWGIPVPWGKVRWDLWQDRTRRSEYQEILREAGRGNPFLVTDDFELGTAFQLPDGDARGMHAALIGWATTEQSKLVESESLTTEVGGQGSYKLAETHADTKEARVANTERCLAESEQRWWKEVLRLACYELAPDGEVVGVNPRGLAGVLSTLHRRRVEPAEIIELCGRPSWRIQREMTPAARMDLYDRAVNKLGLRIMEDQPYQDFGFRRPRSAADSYLRGEAPVLSDTDRLSSSVGTPGSPQGANSDTQPSETGAALELTSTDLGTIVKVNEARSAKGLGPLLLPGGQPDPDGELTIAEYKAKHSAVISEAVSAEQPVKEQAT